MIEQLTAEYDENEQRITELREIVKKDKKLIRQEEFKSQSFNPNDELNELESSLKENQILLSETEKDL